MATLSLDDFYYNAYLGCCLRKVPLRGHIMPTTVRLPDVQQAILLQAYAIVVEYDLWI